MSKKQDHGAVKGRMALLIGTRKGAFILRTGKGRKKWTLSDPILLGGIVHHLVLDPRDGRTLMMAARSGHLGPTIFHSTDGGGTWKEAAQPPAFRKREDGEGLAVRFSFYLTPGHASQPGTWYAGSSPAGLFRTRDGGATWEGVTGFNDNPMREQWVSRPEDEPPGGGTLHSILVDPRDANHLYFGCSGGGVFESVDGGECWQPLNKGCVSYFLGDPEAEYGHDPHCIQLHPQNPDILFQQNHVGIFRMDRKEGVWHRVGEAMPKKVGDIGFPVALHPRDTDTAWVFPMDGTDLWSRISPGAKPAVYQTRDGGQSWKKWAKGLPKKHGYFTVKRQAMAVDRHDPVGVYFGTTGGEVWGANEGGEWELLASHLPEVYSLEVAEVDL